jgi:hypothetical protein
MATRASEEMLWLADEWEDAIDGAFRREDAATFSGIVGDLAHRQTGGYHISREDLIAARMYNDYSLQFSDDLAGRDDLAAAIDMTMSPEAMILVTSRLVAAWNRVDPRLENVRGFCGTLDGRNAIRKDASEADPSAASAATRDHLWHIHMEIFRKFADDKKTMENVLSVITGGREEPGMDQAYLDYLPDTAMAILVGETPNLGFPDQTGPPWDDVALAEHNLKAVEARLTARVAAVEAAVAKIGSVSVTAEEIAKAIIAELRK